MNDYKASDLTLVICAYKECEYLEECIRSVIKQSERPQIMIATSTPNTYIDRIAEKYGIEVKVNPEGGHVKDYNFAMNLPDTELVMLMHQDDMIRKHFVEYCLKEINKADNPIISFTDYVEMHNDQVDKKVSTIVKVKRILLMPMLIKPLMRKGWFKKLVLSFGNPITHPTVICVKKEMPKICFKEKYASLMDWDLWERLSHQKGSFVYIPKVLLYHRMNDQNQTSVLVHSSDIRSREESEIFSRFWPKWIVKIIMHYYSGAQKYY